MTAAGTCARWWGAGLQLPWAGRGLGSAPGQTCRLGRCARLRTRVPGVSAAGHARLWPSTPAQPSAVCPQSSHPCCPPQQLCGAQQGAAPVEAPAQAGRQGSAVGLLLPRIRIWGCAELPAGSSACRQLQSSVFARSSSKASLIVSKRSDYFIGRSVLDPGGFLLTHVLSSHGSPRACGRGGGAMRGPGPHGRGCGVPRGGDTGADRPPPPPPPGSGRVYSPPRRH